MRKPRLKQPLFSKEHGDLYKLAGEDRLLFRIVTAYDCIWSQLYEPSDITLGDIQKNAEANLQNLGMLIEHALGEECFDVDPKQLTFDEAVLNPK